MSINQHGELSLAPPVDTLGNYQKKSKRKRIKIRGTTQIEKLITYGGMEGVLLTRYRKILLLLRSLIGILSSSLNMSLIYFLYEFKKMLRKVDGRKLMEYESHSLVCISFKLYVNRIS